MGIFSQRYAEMFEVMGVALVHEEKDAGIIQLNESAKRMFGMQAGSSMEVFSSTMAKAISPNGEAFFATDRFSFFDLPASENESHIVLGVLLPNRVELSWIEVYPIDVIAEELATSPHMLVALRDISAEFNMQKQASYQQALQSLLLRITQEYISVPLDQLAQQVNLSLHELGDFIGADRIYIFDYDFEARVCNNTFEWCAAGIAPQIELLQGIGMELFPDWLEAHLQGKTMLVQDVSKLPKENGLYEILSEQGIQSLIAVPMMDEQQCLGFVGIDAVRALHVFSDEEQHLLQIFSKALVNVKKRFADENKLALSEERYRQMAENLTEGLWTTDLDFNVEYVSPALSAYLSPGMVFNKEVLFNQFVPDQPASWSQMLFDLLEKAKSNELAKISCDVKYMIDATQYRWVHVCVKTNFNKSGKLEGFLGVLRDIHEQKKAEILLLDLQDQTVERYKELRCVYQATKLSQEDGLTIEAFLQQIVDDLPPSFHYPNDTAAAIQFVGDTYTTPIYFETSTVLKQEIELHGQYIGEIQVYVRGADFLKEELDLLKALSVIIAKFYEKQLTKKELQVSEERYRIIADNTFNWEFWISAEFMFLYHSPACERMTGYSPQQLLDDYALFIEMLHESDRALYHEHLQKMLNGEANTTFQFKMFTKQGQLLHIELVGQRIFSAAGEMLGIRGSHIDITERKMAELELQANQEKLHKLLSTQTFYVIRTDLNGLHTYWNEKFEQDFGWIYHAKGLELSDSLASICTHDWEKASQAAMACLANPGNIVKVELDKPTQSGQIASTLWEFVALVDAEGKPTGVQCMGLDITERRTAEKELRANAEYLTKLMATQTNYVIRTNLEGLHTYWNSKFEEDFGWMYKKRGMAQSDSLASICTYDREKAQSAALECLSAPGTIVKVELDKPSKNGGVMSTLWEFIALVDENGHPTGVQCMGLDITERKQAEIALKKSEEQYRGLIESSDASISMIDADGKYLYMNGIAAGLFGLNTEEAVGKSVYELLAMNDAEAVMKDVKLVLSNNKGVVLEPFLIIEGQRRWFRASIQPIRDADGQPIAVFMHSTEITSQKESELRLKTSEQKYKTLFFDSPDAYLMLSNGVFIECNHAAELLIEGDRDYIIGKSPAEISPAFQPNGKESEVYAKELLLMAHEKGKTSFEWEHFKANGERFLALVNLATIEYEQKEVIFISWQDITKQKAAQEGIKRFSQIIEQSPFSVVMTDLDGKLVYANAFAAKSSGYSKEDILGLGFEKLYPTQTIEVTFKELLANLQEGKEWRGTIEGRKIDGSPRWESGIFFPIADDSGMVKNYIGIIEDITDKLAVEEALNQSERRSSEIAEHSRTVIWEVNIDGLYTYVSPVSETVYMRKPEEIIGKLHYYDLHPEAGREELIAMFEEAKQQKLTVMDLENPIELPGGEIIWVSTNATPFINCNGDLVGYRGSDKDITAKKIADEAVRKFRIISDQANYGTAIAHLDGTLQYVNEAYARMHGYAPEELMGNNVIMLHDPTVLDYPEALFEEIRGSSGFAAKEVMRLRKDGTSFPALMSSAIIGDASTGDSFLSATIIDITERKEMEQTLIELNTTLETRIEERTQALRWSNEELVQEIANRKRFETELQIKSNELQTFFDVSLDLMCIADLSGNFVKLNQAWVDLLGYTMQDLLTRKFLEFVHPDDLDSTLEVMGHLSQQQRVVSFTNRYKTADGNYRFIEWHSVPVGELIYAAARDITERIQQTEALTLARKVADEANQSKSEFLSRMSHELRTPLNSILGFAQLLAMGHLAEAQQKGVNHILRSGRHLLDLINEVLDISRIEAGRISVSVEPVSVQHVLVETIELLTPYAQSRRISLHMPEQIDKKLMVLADQQRLKQVITNIMNNALKYNKDGGDVWVTANLMPITSNGARYVCISVKDTGVGIASSDLDKVFNPFERLSAVDTPTEGTGLGLTVVKQLLELMGGTVKVDSELGKGSTFEVYLPYTRSRFDKLLDEQDMQNGHLVAESSLKATILYIEDNNSNLELVEQILAMSQENVELVHTAYGGMALAKAKECKPSLILLDLNLPDTHGSQVIQWLKNDEVTRHIPVIVVSADAMPDQVKELMRLGAVNYLTKPLDVQVFLSEIHKYIR